MRAYLKCPPVQRCRDIVEQPAYERLDHVRMASREALGLQPVQISEQRQRERIAVREAERLGLQRLWYSTTRQVGPALLGPEVAKRQHLEHRSPARIGAPLHAGQLSAGDHDQRLGRQAGQILFPEPAIE
jgi:hypothetical protein